MQLVDLRKKIKNRSGVEFFINLINFLVDKTYNDPDIESLNSLFKYESQNATPMNENDNKSFINKAIFKDYCSFFGISYSNLTDEEKKRVEDNFLRSINSSTGLAFSSSNLYSKGVNQSEDIRLVLNVSGKYLFRVATAVYQELKNAEVNCTIRLPFNKNVSLGLTDSLCVEVSSSNLENAVTVLQSLPIEVKRLISSPSLKFAAIDPCIGYDFYNHEAEKWQSLALMDAIRDGIYDAVTEIIESNPEEAIENLGDKIGEFREYTPNKLYADLKILSRTLGVTPYLMDLVQKHVLDKVRKLNNCDYAYANALLEEVFNKLDSDNQMSLYSFGDKQVEVSEQPDVTGVSEQSKVIANEAAAESVEQGTVNQEIVVEPPKIEFSTAAQQENLEQGQEGVEEATLGVSNETPVEANGLEETQVPAETPSLEKEPETSFEIPDIGDYDGISLIFALQNAGYPYNFEYRKKVADALGIEYQSVVDNKKLADDNERLLEALKEYALKLKEQREKETTEVVEQGESVEQQAVESTEGSDVLVETKVDSIAEQPLGNLEITQVIPIVDDVALKSEEAKIVGGEPSKTSVDPITQELQKIAFSNSSSDSDISEKSESQGNNGSILAPLTEEEKADLNEIFESIRPLSQTATVTPMPENKVVSPAFNGSVPEVSEDTSIGQGLVGGQEQFEEVFSANDTIVQSAGGNVIPAQEQTFASSQEQTLAPVQEHVLSSEEKNEVGEILEGALDKRFIDPKSLEQMQGLVAAESMTPEQKDFVNKTLGELEQAEVGIEQALSGLGSSVVQNDGNSESVVVDPSGVEVGIDQASSFGTDSILPQVGGNAELVPVDPDDLTGAEINNLVDSQIGLDITQEQLQKYEKYVSDLEVLKKQVPGTQFALFDYFENNDIANSINPDTQYKVMNDEVLTGKEFIDNCLVKYVLNNGDVRLDDLLDKYGIDLQAYKDKKQKRGFLSLFKRK